LNAAGSALVYSTYLGGSSGDVGYGIAVDASRNAYVSGTTTSIDFPTTPGAFQPSYAGGAGDAFITKLNAAGSALVDSTYLGGGIGYYGAGDGAYGIAVDASGNAYVAGTTTSFDFPTTEGAFQPIKSWVYVDAFVAKISFNRAPVANAGPDQTVECTSPAGEAVTLDGSASSDPDNNPLTYEWKDAAGSVVGNTPMVNLTLPLGTHVFTLTVNDGQGGTASDSVAVIVQDTTPPTLGVSLSPKLLWPPNHKLVPVVAVLEVSDLCDPSPTVVLVSIVSNEADNGQGDGDVGQDVQGASFGTDDRSFLLRAERAGGGAGRIYTVTYRARDASGNMRLASANVIVPHDSR
jgi:hypothetical protein